MLNTVKTTYYVLATIFVLIKIVIFLRKNGK